MGYTFPLQLPVHCVFKIRINPSFPFYIYIIYNLNIKQRYKLKKSSKYNSVEEKILKDEKIKEKALKRQNVTKKGYYFC